MSDAQLVACEADANFAAMWIKFQSAPSIQYSDPRVQARITALDVAGYLPNHVAVVLAAWPPQ